MIEIPKRYTDPKKGEWITSAVPGLPTKHNYWPMIIFAVVLVVGTLAYKFWPY